jgi:Holliday junction resolvasome RuvABC endonuclease subunit
MKVTHIGIDPGLSGGIAWIRDGQACAVKMPETHRDVLDVFQELRREGPCFAVLEKVHSMPGQGVVSAFTFGKGFGALEMALTAAEIPYEHVTPQKWQKAMGCLTKGDKNVSKRRSQELFPALKITHATADSLLIAHYNRLTTP